MTHALHRLALAAALIALAALAQPAAAQDPSEMKAIRTSHGFAELVERLNQAVKDEGMYLVTRASASHGARNRGIDIPGNMVVGVFRNDFAIRMLEASVAAGIEAPIRFYITENADGTASLRYYPPSAVFAPYDDGGAKLDALATELDAIFARIAEKATAD